MKDKWEEGALYCVVVPGTAQIYIAKAYGGYPCKRVSFFFCDLEGTMNWNDIESAYRVELRVPTYSEMRERMLATQPKQVPYEK